MSDEEAAYAAAADDLRLFGMAIVHERSDGTVEHIPWTSVARQPEPPPPGWINVDWAYQLNPVK